MSRRRDPAYWMEVGRLAELGLLSSTLLHELKQPLFAIKATLQVNLPDPDDESCDAAHRVIMEQVLQMERIMEAHGGLSQKPGDWDEPFAPALPIQAACRALKVRARRQGATIEVEVGSAVPTLRGNPVALQQVIVNLLQNALDAVEKAEEPQVTVCVKGHDEHVEILVADNGPGIRPDDLDRIFEPWFSTKRPGRGTGLGLPIVRKLVEDAGGALDVARHAGGTTMRVCYPVRTNVQDSERQEE